MTTHNNVHLIFKTHLDIGFTDFAAQVVHTYFTEFIPKAVALARRTREQGLPRFRWTVGSWLIYEYLEQANPAQRQAMEAAIEAGDITWHALPFTLHTELVDESLFRFGLGYFQELDRRFGKTTIAAKATDVPGHTRAMVPLLAEAGVKFLHIGVNPASTVPAVPPVFVWRDAATSTELLVIYDDTYGGVTRIPGLDAVLAVILTGDNEGPPSDQTVADTYTAIAAQVPGASITASTLDDFARQLDRVRHQLPVITAEIGDTWIHGVGTDPTKVRHYRALSRLRRDWLTRPLAEADRARVDAFSRHLLMVPEHTWGMDEKTHLADDIHYLKPDLAQLRTTEKGQKFESSWAEQRAYLSQAIAALDSSALAAEAVAQIANTKPRKPQLGEPISATAITLENQHYHIAFDPQTGAISRLLDRRSSVHWADSNHQLARLGYEVFGAEDYQRFWQQYIRNQDDAHVRYWAREDYTKPGLPIDHHQAWLPEVNGVYQNTTQQVVFALVFPGDAQQFGAPAEIFLEYTLVDQILHIALSWFDKPAARLAEAFWLSFQPASVQQWTFEKLGQLISPDDVISGGARTLHAVDARILAQQNSHQFELVTLDAPLVAPGQPSLLNFHNQLPDMHNGFHVNLYNNVWGTNFPMWFEDDAVFRFTLQLK